jgi:predicted  nucleic acid-binding Zn-ribbon protein
MDTRRQVEDWIQLSCRIFEDDLPVLLAELNALMRRALTAEKEVVDLGERNAVLCEEIAQMKSEHELQVRQMKSEHELLVRRHMEIADNMGRTMAHLRQVFDPVKDMLGAKSPGS